MPAHSSSADDYRSVIDDLTVENKRLKEELKRYKQFGPDPLRKDKLFEIKFHGLPPNKRRELEATLRDFASSLEGSSSSSEQQRKKSSKNVSRLEASSLHSKQESSSSSRSRPVADSAYASMSTGPNSLSHHASGSSLGRPLLARTRSSTDQRVESYLRDIPQGLMPRHISLTGSEKKKVVVRRLEHLFTGRFGGKSKRQPEAQLGYGDGYGETVSTTNFRNAAPMAGPGLPHEEPREARIQLNESSCMANSREEFSTSNGDNDARENRMGSGSGSNEHSGSGNSPQNVEGPEQRATRPLDLDPDRPQIPSENMDYIRHLGAMAPEYLPAAKYKSSDVSMDADGWIHLNLLCSLAQLHILNVTPDYIRQAVSERSAKFQLSRDGRKIRWRGGTHGTKFSSDSSGDSSERSPDALATDGSNDDGQRKRQRTSGQVSPVATKLQAATSTGGFHYKPMFVHHSSSSAATSLDESESQTSYPRLDNSNFNSRSTGFVSGSVSSPCKKRRRDGAVIYYTGAPFCLDLSGDPGYPGDDSPTAHMASTAQAQAAGELDDTPNLYRTESGSSLPYRPLVDGPELMETCDDVDPEYVSYDTDTDEIEGFCWCEQPEKTELKPLQATLEPCGLGGVVPEDHFAVLVVTRHPIMSPHWPRHTHTHLQSQRAKDIASRIPATSLQKSSKFETPAYVQCQVMEERYKQLKPLPLPPPGNFYSPIDTTESGSDSGFEDDEDDEGNDYLSKGTTSDSDEASQRANPHQSDILRLAENSDEDDDIFDNTHLKSIPRVAFASMRRASNDSFAKIEDFGRGVGVDSSAATAGEASGYSSGREDE